MADGGGFDRGPEMLEGGPDRPWPTAPRRPRWAGAAAIVLVAGGLVGYAVGAAHHSPGGSARSSPATRPASRGGSTIVGGPPMVQTGATCSVQHGHHLQLGIQINNESDLVVDVIAVHTRQPVPGLRVIRTTAGSCGERTHPLEPFSNAVAPAGASIWVTATERVLVRCPGADPVQFDVHYVQNGHAYRQLLPGFADLSQVPYTGCASSG